MPLIVGVDFESEPKSRLDEHMLANNMIYSNEQQNKQTAVVAFHPSTI